MKSLIPKGRNDGHIFDYSKIDENIYIGSDLCKGSVCSVHASEFKQIGVCAEINLSAERKELPPDDIDIYSWLPVIDGYAPTDDQLDLGTNIIDVSVKNGKTIYVHCANGHGRSPTMVAGYYIRFKGFSVEEAIMLLKEKRPEVHIEDEQKKALNEYYKKWSK